MAIWDDVLTDQDRVVYEGAGWGKPAGYGKRPALLIVDVIYNFVGDKPEPILESIKKWRYSCGEVGWEGVHALQRLIAKARQKHIPLFYTTWERRADLLDNGAWNRKNYRVDDPIDVQGHKGNQIVAEVAPHPEDIAFVKKKPSAFFGTPLVGYLIDMKVDTLILTGTTTSGCIRATAVDGFSYNYYVVVPEECAWDRGEVSHKINLFDIQEKYGDVRKLEDVLSYLDGLEDDLYAGVLPHVSARAD
ncbi:MAG: hydrolase [Chloroflexi bacterium RBG_13_68_17]|jgi:nicotinamidase-related amidase|nr:MAG: hydrolase [Chloroflexi bacterium RBG_13_68_17]